MSFLDEFLNSTTAIDACPKCYYPAGYKGIYTIGAKCSGCGFTERDPEILEAYQQLMQAKKVKAQCAERLRQKICSVHRT